MSKQAPPTPRPTRPHGPSIPADWTRIDSGGPAPFVSWVTYRLPDGSHYTWRSRHYRKGAGARTLYADRAGLRTTPSGEPLTIGNPWLRFWAPHRLAWWVAMLFIVGSALFVAGAAGSLAPALFGGQHRMSVFAESCYFGGAVLYTVGIYAQLLEAINADERIDPNRESHAPTRFRWFTIQLADLTRLEVLTPLVFLIGSVAFNYETTVALGGTVDLLPKTGAWQTSLAGSVFFLLAGVGQYIEAGHRYLSRGVRDVSWWIGVWFILGSVGFVIGSLPGLGTPGIPGPQHGAGPLIVKVGFLVGGIAYLAGSYLLLPELFTLLRSHPKARTPQPHAA